MPANGGGGALVGRALDAERSHREEFENYLSVSSTAPPRAGTHTDQYGIVVMGNPTAPGHRMHYYEIIDGVYAEGTQISTFDLTSHRYWRLAHDPVFGRFSWATRPTTDTPWTVRRELAPVFPIDSVVIELGAGQYTWPDASVDLMPGKTRFDNAVLCYVPHP